MALLCLPELKGIPRIVRSWGCMKSTFIAIPQYFSPDPCGRLCVCVCVCMFVLTSCSFVVFRILNFISLNIQMYLVRQVNMSMRMSAVLTTRKGMAVYV